MKPPPQSGEVRIIGGQWRRRRLPFPAHAALRPTPDRLRETLFNWLMPSIVGTRCLDLFAGSGALGLEALSRGAERAVLVEADAQVAQALRDNAARLGARTAEVVTASALDFLRGPAAAPFHIVFLDPPFDSSLMADCLPLLAARWLGPDARVYIERPATQAGIAPVGLPPAWQLWRETRVGQAHGAVYRVPAENLLNGEDLS